jgi:hypothetical protein
MRIIQQIRPVRALDPILIAIERHRITDAALIRCHEREAALQEILPAKRRRWVEGRRPAPCKDAPEWIEARLATVAADDADDLALLTLLHTTPTTAAGIVAALRYAHEYIASGGAWPEARDGKVALGDGRAVMAANEFDVIADWHQRLADALEMADPCNAGRERDHERDTKRTS